MTESFQNADHLHSVQSVASKKIHACMQQAVIAVDSFFWYNRDVALKVVRPESELDFGTGPNGRYGSVNLCAPISVYKYLDAHTW